MKKDFKVLSLSDLIWNPESKNITFSQLELATNIDITESSQFNSISYYYSIILLEKPEVVVLAGDVIGQNGIGYCYAFLFFLQLLERDKIHTLFIAGNHDDETEYNYCVDYCKNMKYIDNCDEGKVVSIRGKKFFGLSYFDTNTKSSVNNYLSSHEKVDFLIAHCEQKRRLSLFDFKTQVIITGHYDRKVAYANNILYISHDNDYMPDYSCIVIGKEFRLTYFVFNNAVKAFDEYRFVKTSKNELVFDGIYSYDQSDYISTDKIIYNPKFCDAIAEAIEIKKKNMKISAKKLNEFANIHLHERYKLGKKFFIDYFGKSRVIE